jgi:hypothetical protein
MDGIRDTLQAERDLLRNQTIQGTGATLPALLVVRGFIGYDTVLTGQLINVYLLSSDMKRLAKKRGVDLLLVDSGDLHDGAGLSDGFSPGQGPDGHVSNE